MFSLQHKVNYCKKRKYGALQNVAPLLQLPLSTKIYNVPMIFNMYSIKFSVSNGRLCCFRTVSSSFLKFYPGDLSVTFRPITFVLEILITSLLIPFFRRFRKYLRPIYASYFSETIQKTKKKENYNQ